jgi:hypothetical protein
VSRLLSLVFGAAEVSGMIRFRVTWLVLLAMAAALFMLNWQCWQPGVGGAVGGRPPGTQLELFFGWPATYQAELWRSDDEALASRILASAPFYYPDGEMSLECRAVGMRALALNLLFAVLMLLSVAVMMECALRRVWNSRVVAVLAGAGLLLLALLAASQPISVSQ